MRKYTYGYKINDWTENGIGKNFSTEIVRIFSNRDRISILIGTPKDNDDTDIEDLNLNLGTYTFRLKRKKINKNTYTYSWLSKELKLTKIWIGFDSSRVEIINDNSGIDELGSNQFMYGKGNVNKNNGKVYSDSAVTDNYGEIYGDGDVAENNSGGKVYGNGFVGNEKDTIDDVNDGTATEVYGNIYGNGGVGYNYWAYVYGNSYININEYYSYGNGNINTNKWYVYGNGDVKNNYKDVYGNGRIYDDTYGKWFDNTDISPSNGETITVTNKKTVVNGGIITDTTNDPIKGNTVNTPTNYKSDVPNAIVNNSVIHCSGTSDSKIHVYGNDITGNNNVINGFRIYKIDENETIEHIVVGNVRTNSDIYNYGYTDLAANVIIGNYNVINPNYISNNKNDVKVYPNVVVGNSNVINDPDTIVLKGTCNIFNDPKN